jgi:hypothetical protein
MSMAPDIGFYIIGTSTAYHKTFCRIPGYQDCEQTPGMPGQVYLMRHLIAYPNDMTSMTISA